MVIDDQQASAPGVCGVGQRLHSRKALAIELAALAAVHLHGLARGKRHTCLLAKHIELAGVIEQPHAKAAVASRDAAVPGHHAAALLLWHLDHDLALAQPHMRLFAGVIDINCRGTVEQQRAAVFQGQ
ncbi:hypothetical protein D3C79_866020 [compost metagenome]